MNNFKKLMQITQRRKNNINKIYDILDKNKLNEELQKQKEYFEKLLKNIKLEVKNSSILAMVRRFVDLKEENLIQELEQNHFDKHQISKIKAQIYNEVKKFYENEHEKLIEEIKDAKILNVFYVCLIEGIHSIGKVLNSMQEKWQQKIIEENNEFLSSHFENLDEALKFLKDNKLYQKDRNNDICERSYGVIFKNNQTWQFLPYALAFKEHTKELRNAFDRTLNKLQSLASNTEEKAYIDYLEKLKLAFCEENNDKVIQAWQNAELAWMQVKSPLQIGHPLEYYEDSYTHAVALEWDIRVEDASDFNAAVFNQEIKESFDQIYHKLGIKNQKLYDSVCENFNKTQLYICSPMIFYGAELNGLFSAQVVPNDEFVSQKAGKKIFAFLNFVYENAKTKPFMKLSSMIFEKEFLDYGREILFFNKTLWKKVYEISTIGHEFGHMFFIDENTEKIMNESGYFKNIEEFKATMGGLVNFFLHEKEELKMPVFHELIKRAIGLIAWQKVEEVKPYYTEGLIHLHILFQSKVLSFENNKLQINFNSIAYENFKEEAINTYLKLAKHYSLKLDAKEFLNEFCILENEVFLPKNAICKEFVLYYYKLYEQFANIIDDSDEIKKYRK
ncbi:invasion protein CiaB [Campylobacter sp. US33a]|uniref:invasion protein CiaB n=1 Tax=Campylobacter sp. US33a TaxID=2498120 RepID=UPI0010683289|nr:invasion protein CiaB [Campylobacter sp. US33a]TEY04086.1 hypothetical protein ELQ16_02260 [Campylobacter sp. US33a]